LASADARSLGLEFAHASFKLLNGDHTHLGLKAAYESSAVTYASIYGYARGQRLWPFVCFFSNAAILSSSSPISIIRI
jgi:hypothetical protein